MTSKEEEIRSERARQLFIGGDSAQRLGTIAGPVKEQSSCVYAGDDYSR